MVGKQKKKSKKSIYSDVSTLALKKGERTFPFSCFKDINVDWDKVYESWITFIHKMKEDGVIIKRHGDNE